MKRLAGVLALLGLGDGVFRDGAESAFRFLIDEFAFSEPSFTADVFGATVTYRGPIVAVLVAWDKQERIIEVYVVRLRHGELPLYVDEPREWISLDALLGIRAPHLLSALTERTGRSLRNVDRLLLTAATALREHGESLLTREPSAFAVLADQLARSGAGAPRNA